MARAFTSAQLRTRLEEMTNTVGDSHLSTAEKYAILTSAVASTWDHIVAAGLGTEYVKNVTFNTSTSTPEVLISTAVAAGDFYRVSEMYVSEGNGQFRPIPRIPPGDRYGWKTPPTAQSIKMYYLPCAPVWTDGTGSFDGINGWEEHTLAKAAVTVKNKKGDDAGPYKAICRDLEARMMTMANRNGAEPPRVIRRSKANRETMWMPRSTSVGGWDIRGVNFEFMYRDAYHGVW